MGRRAQVGLTAAERRVLRALLCKGESDKQLALALGISTRTVSGHMQRILHKTGAPGRTGLIVKAFREQWVDTESDE